MFLKPNREALVKACSPSSAPVPPLPGRQGDGAPEQPHLGKVLTGRSRLRLSQSWVAWSALLGEPLRHGRVP